MNEWDELGFNAQQSAPPPPGGPGPGQYPPPRGGPDSLMGSAGYGGPQQPYYAQPRGGQGGGWIGFLRVFLWIWFGIICLAGLIYTVVMMQVEPLMGLLVLVATAIVAFASVAGGMVMLDAAKNIETCATNSAQILAEMQKQNRTR